MQRLFGEQQILDTQDHQVSTISRDLSGFTVEKGPRNEWEAAIDEVMQFLGETNRGKVLAMCRGVPPRRYSAIS